MLLPDQPEVFYGAVDPAAAQVYVRWSASRPQELAGITLGGTIRGPFSRLARTLPATVPLVDQGPGESLLARAVVPDPCYWVPGAPYLYAVRVEARHGGRVVAEAECTLGIRPLGVAGRRFKLAGKGWMPRAVHRDLVQPMDVNDLAAWRELGAVMIARSPSDDLCRQASQQGVLIFAEGSPGDVVAEIRRLERWPAVGMIVLPAGVFLPADRPLARNLLVARHFAGKDLAGADLPSPPNSAAHCWLVEADDAELMARAAEWALPIVAARRATRPMSLADARAECDALQADLAARVGHAGRVPGSATSTQVVYQASGRIEIAGLAMLPPN
jgi:hypothetical protein